MLFFFPKIYTDELLFSVLSRYHLRSGNLTIKDTTSDLFGKKKMYIIPDLTTDLETLLSKIKHFVKYDPDYLINNHTLYNYFTNFNSNSIKQSVKGYMLKDNGNNKVHYLTGQIANSVKEPTYFKYCPECLKRDIEVKGESYWRTYHQLNSVFVCLEHNELLEDSSVYFRHDNSLFNNPSIENCIVTKNKSKNGITNVNTYLLRVIAEESYRITNRNYNFNQSKLLDIYRYLLQSKGYLKPNKTINQIKLREDFIKFYGINLLELMQSVPTGVDGSCWLRAITRKHRKSFHPVRHLLFIQFLGESVDTINLYEKKVYLPFDKGPYLCLNAAADHYLKPVITNLKVTTCYDTKRPVGTFSCTCGFVYSRRGPDLIQDDKKKIGRIKEFGDIWLYKLNYLINVEKLSFRACARILNVDTKTIIKYANNKIKRNKEFSTRLNNEIKNLWLELMNKFPELSRTDLRKINPSLYMKLYRSDKDWLFENPSKKLKSKSENRRINWNERDFEILEEVKKATSKLNNMNRPTRITLSRIGKLINRLSLLEKKLDKLPLTKKFLNEVCESVEEFQKRRIKWVVEQLEIEELSLWKIKRMAGLKEGNKLDSEIKNQINFAYSIQRKK